MIRCKNQEQTPDSICSYSCSQPCCVCPALKYFLLCFLRKNDDERTFRNRYKALAANELIAYAKRKCVRDNSIFKSVFQSVI